MALDVIPAMKHHHLGFLLVVGLAALFALFSGTPLASAPSAGNGISLRFAPSAGATFSKTFSTRSELSLDEVSMKSSVGEQQQKIERTMTASQEVHVVDQYGKVEDGMPRSVLRSFESLASEASIQQTTEVLGQSEAREQNLRAKSRLEGRKVQFTRNDETNTFDKRFEPELDEPTLLAGLEEDMDLRCFLPGREVAVGETWNVRAELLGSILAPGGNLSFAPENSDARGVKIDGNAAASSASLSTALNEHLTGKVVAKLVLSTDRTAIVHLTLQLKAEVDLTESTKEMLSGATPPEGAPPIDITSYSVTFTLEGEGDLVWDIQEHRFQSFDLSGRTGIKSVTKSIVEVNKKQITMEQTDIMSGTNSIKARVE